MSLDVRGVPRGPAAIAAPDSPGARHHLNENPLGTSQGALRRLRRIVRESDLSAYPDPSGRPLIRAIAAFHGVDERMVVIGNGTDELILALAAVTRETPGRAACVCAQTFQSYPKSLDRLWQRVIQVPLRDARIDVDAIVRAMADRPTVTFVCNPHNPTGSVLSRESIALISECAGRTGALVVFDEAYAEFADPPFASAIDRVSETGGVAVLRTFSKAYGLASLRVGYLIAPVGVAALLTEFFAAMPFHVNRIAQEVAAAALADQAFIAASQRHVESVRSQFCAALPDAGVVYLPSHVNFVLVRPPVDSRPVPRLFDGISARLRDTTDMGFPGWFRVSMTFAGRMLDLLDPGASGGELPRRFEETW